MLKNEPSNVRTEKTYVSTLTKRIVLKRTLLRDSSQNSESVSISEQDLNSRATENCINEIKKTKLS